MFDKDSDTTNDSVERMPSHGPSIRANVLGATPVDLARMGLNQIAYIRPATVDNVAVWSIHNAAGDQIGAAESFDQAWGAVRQHDMEPTRVH